MENQVASPERIASRTQRCLVSLSLWPSSARMFLAVAENPIKFTKVGFFVLFQRCRLLSARVTDANPRLRAILTKCKRGSWLTFYQLELARRLGEFWI